MSGLVLGLGISAHAQIRITDYRRLVTVTGVQVSPNGRYVAFIKSVPNFKEDTRFTTVEVADTKTGAISALTNGSRTVSSPRWSAKGDRVAFLAEDGAKNAQLCVCTLATKSTKQLTHRGKSIQQFAWSPKGDRLVFVVPDEPTNAAAAKRHNDFFDIHDDGLLTSSIPTSSHLWLISSSGSGERRLTGGSWSALENPPPFTGSPSDPSWSEDGKSIAFIRQANADDADTDLTSAAVVDVASGSVRNASPHSTYEYQAMFVPSSHSVAYLLPHGPTALSSVDVCMTDSQGHETNLTADLDRDVQDYKWMPDGRTLIAYANDGVMRPIWLIKPGEQPQKLDTLGLGASELHVGSNGAIAYVASDPTHANEVYYMASPGSRPKRLTNFNETLDSLHYAKEEELTWTAPDGEKCDGVLTYPFGFSQDKKYPLVTFIHGGPEAAAPMLYLGFEGDILRQSLAADGYAVFEPNYRGSDNLGNGHEHAIYKNPAEGPASDILSGIDSVIKRGFVDDQRQVVAGHSYGGYMTAWLISHDHRWKCAVVGDGAVNWLDTYNFAADGNLAWARDSLGGTPWDAGSGDLFVTSSPIHYAGDITTPTLILSGTSDETVPITESYELFHALKDHNVPVRFIGIPGAHHSPDDPVRYELFYASMEQWIKHYLQ